MALPILETPKFSTNLPSDNLRVDFRPFTVKEQKNLMIVQQGGDEKTALKALGDCLTACVEQEINLQNRPVIDFEWLFLQVRSKSVGETIELTTKCQKCGNVLEFEMDINKIEKPKFPDNKVKINGDLTIEFRAVSLSDLHSVKEPNEIVAKCAKAVFYKNESYTEFTTDEFLKFIEPLTLSDYKKVDEYFSSQPNLKLETKAKCFKCGVENQVKMEGVFNFFH